MAPEPSAAGHDPGAGPARPDLDDGDHDRMAHIVLEGYTPKEGEQEGDSSRPARAWSRAS